MHGPQISLPVADSKSSLFDLRGEQTSPGSQVDNGRLDEFHLVIAVRGTAEDDLRRPVTGTDEIAICKRGALHNVGVVSLTYQAVFSGQLINELNSGVVGRADC